MAIVRIGFPMSRPSECAGHPSKSWLSRESPVWLLTSIDLLEDRRRIGHLYLLRQQGPLSEQSHIGPSARISPFNNWLNFTLRRRARKEPNHMCGQRGNLTPPAAEKSLTSSWHSLKKEHVPV